MSELGSYGPGWFYNIFGIIIEFNNSLIIQDDGEVFAIPWFSYTGEKYLFSNKNNIIKGKIILNTYNNKREVWHGGIKISVEEYIHTLDPYVSVETKHYETVIANEDIVKGTATYDFSFPLLFPKNKMKESVSPYCRRTWCNTFNGNTFGIRHVFHVIVLRPWYTFNCQKQVFLSLHRLDQKELNSTSYDTNPIVLNTTGLKDNGKCALKLNSQTFDLSNGRDPSTYGRGGVKTCGSLSGSIKVSDLTDPITSIVILLIRKEFVGRLVTNETIEFEHTVIGYELDNLKSIVGVNNGEEEVSKDYPKSRGYWERLDLGDDNPQHTDPIKIGSVISFEIPFDGYTNLHSNVNSDSVRGFIISGDKNSHQHRLQYSLWNNLRIYPSFSYLPLLAPPGEELEIEESKRGNDSKDIDKSTDLEEIHIDNEEIINFPIKETDIFKVHSVLPEESVSLKYYVRLVVQESSGNRHWNSQEIQFYDSGNSSLPPYVDEIRKGHDNLEAV